MRKLLIIDDNTELLDAMQNLISSYDFTVRTATDKKTLLKEFKSFIPEIVLIDIVLSNDDGEEICKTLREDPLNKEITMILFSAFPKRLINFQECGADGIIEKPFGIKRLLEVIETSIQYRKNILANEI